MKMHLVRSVTVLLLLAGLCVAQEVVLKKVPVTYTTPTDGERMYTRYCASCHGSDAKGHGPALKALSRRPPNLTTLASRNHGTYPALHVAQTLRGEGASLGHVEKDMPEWGEIFRSLNPGGDHTDSRFLMRIASLNAYIKSLQTK